ncbi:hypothetical protein SAMN02745121_08485 [Nannocystis exedens]|uniref:Esterase n=1 Tax=Nannocystis exedens TaxID=54 RepID=A0A1I2I8N0_9BACT|nr:hypothetical protein [Nannocystis exedens]PCC74132.1 hypothetical protein NAEX_07221 [Nannocystis exedens]SFF38028.1 hypothetical protein SAMN02745121_08485 [Nannocystis exedens]
MRAALALLALLACQPASPPAQICGPTTPAPKPAAASSAKVTMRVRPGLVDGPLQGRLLVLLAAGGEQEPRFMVGDDDHTAQVFGLDVEGWPSGQPIALAGDVAGYPLADWAALPAGEYRAQAVLHRYETFRRADGHVVSLPPDRGEGQQWNRAPGNLISAPQHVRIEPGGATELALELDQVISPLPPVTDTRLLRHVELESPLLTTFWGRSTKLGARVLLPEGWDTHPEARYPLMIYHSHFGRELAGYRETPPDPGLPPVDREGLARECPNGHGPACARLGYERMVQEAGYRFHQQWTGPDFPRVILVQLEHANPYYDDSYAVNSQNLGPYGDAITHELVPHLEQQFRGLGAWARGLYGGSTGGWEAIAAQVLYPDEYNGAVGNCPDPLDFRAYVTIDIYADENAYYAVGPFRRTPRIGSRRADGTARSLVEQDNRLELALGTRSRSGQQFDIWEAVYSPVGPDGYPRRIFDKQTGVIDREVAAHWHEHYDIGHIITRDWARLAPKLRGKLWLNTGDMDTYYLERSVRLIEARMRELDPPPEWHVAYGHGDGHCWSGDRDHMNFESRLTYHSRFIPLLVDHFLRTAPPGADTTSWRY